MTTLNKKEPSVRSKKKDSSEIVYNIVKDAIDIQRFQKSTLETKANTLIAFAAGIIALLMGARDTILTLPSLQQTLTLISIFLISISVVLSTIVAWVRRYRIDPSPEALAEFYVDENEDKTRRQIISNWIGTWKSNAILIERNALILRSAFLTQTLGFVLLGVILFLSIL